LCLGNSTIGQPQIVPLEQVEIELANLQQQMHTLSHASAVVKYESEAPCQNK